jgi:hypothetical protein
MRSLRILGLAVLGWTVLSVIPGQAQTNPAPLKLSAFAVNMSNVATGANSQVDINITRWSTEAERQKLITTFTEKGPNKLLDALQDQKPVGYLKLPTRLGYDLRFARQIPLEDGGRRILILTDRPIAEFEAREQARTLDYPFTLIELHLKKDDTGVGTISVATKITLNKKDNTVELENWESEPVRLNNIHVVK